jgi:hypothetical protein
VDRLDGQSYRIGLGGLYGARGGLGGLVGLGAWGLVGLGLWGAWDRHNSTLPNLSTSLGNSVLSDLSLRLPLQGGSELPSIELPGRARGCTPRETRRGSIMDAR